MPGSMLDGEDLGQGPHGVGHRNAYVLKTLPSLSKAEK